MQEKRAWDDNDGDNGDGDDACLSSFLIITKETLFSNRRKKDWGCCFVEEEQKLCRPTWSLAAPSATTTNGQRFNFDSTTATSWACLQVQKRLPRSCLRRKINHLRSNTLALLTGTSGNNGRCQTTRSHWTHLRSKAICSPLKSCLNSRHKNKLNQNTTKMVSVRLVLKIYSLFLGCVVSFMSFMWVAFELYVVSQTPPDQVTMLTPTLYKT